jgi:uncharacterized protein
MEEKKDLWRVIMKPSRYNKFFEAGNDSIIAYNTLSGALANLDREQYQKVQYVLAKCPELKESPGENNEYLNFLLNGRFLVEDDVNELDILKARNLLGKFTQDKLGVTILPTLNCNFRCIYCFEEHKNETMSSDVLRNLAEWVKVQMQHRKRLEVGWFGGEPLLCLDIIRELTSIFRQICAQRGCEYRADMSTNGYLLTKDVVKELKELGITQIQVPLDGPARIHDKRRPLAGGFPTFDVIISNLIALLEEGGIELSIRPTIDKGNVEGIYELMDTLVLAGIHDKIIFNPQNVESSPANDLGCMGTCIPNTAEFADIRANILIYATELGFKIDPPDLLCQGCPSHNINSFMVSPKGDMFKCGSFLRPEDRIGYLDPADPEKAHIDSVNMWRWVGSDPFEDEQCRECDVLPLCMGGCQAKRRQSGEKDGHCIYYRYNLEKELVGRYGRKIDSTARIPPCELEHRALPAS